MSFSFLGMGTQKNQRRGNLRFVGEDDWREGERVRD